MLNFDFQDEKLLELICLRTPLTPKGAFAQVLRGLELDAAAKPLRSSPKGMNKAYCIYNLN